MTPAERARTRAEYLAELDEALQDLPLLHRRIEVNGQRLAGIGADIADGRELGDIAERLGTVDDLVEAVIEYRETRGRCSGLLQALGRYSTGGSVLGNAALLDDFPRF